MPIPPPSWLLPVLALGIALFLPLYALRARGRAYGAYAAVMVIVSFPAAVALVFRLQALAGPTGGAVVGWLAVYTLCATGVHLSSLVKARLRTRLYRYGISMPGMAFVALGALCVPWFGITVPLNALLWSFGADSALAAMRWLDIVPVVVIGVSMATSLRLRRELVRVHLGGEEPDAVVRLPLERHSHRRAVPAPVRPALRIVQLTDPHLGPWQPVHRLAARIEELLGHEPHLVLLTGDFLTMEGNGTPGALARALAPLKGAPGRCFAILGNHDHEAPEEVRAALEANGVHLLVDEAAVVETPVGPVQLVGADFHRKERARRIQALLERHPRIEDHLRLFLLHDPLGFHDVPRGDVDLTLSGHTHGGQVGLVSFGLNWTVLSRSRWPDHGLFGHGASRLYVHRGTGFYGFPLRIGVPGEASVLELIPEA